MARMSSIPSEIAAEMTPAVRAYVEGLLRHVAALEAQVAGLESQLAAVRAEAAAFEARASALQGRVEALQGRVASFEGGNGNSAPQNSSAPPSTVHPHGKPAPKPKKKKGRKRGGQPGHAKRSRPLIDEANAWQNERNRKKPKIDWQFTAEDARIKLKHLYPKNQS